MDALPQGTPAGLAGTLATSGVALVSVQQIPPHLDPHDIALWLTIVSSTLSIILAVMTLLAFICHRPPPSPPAS